MVSTRWNSHASDLELKSRGAFFFLLFSLLSSFGTPLAPPPPPPPPAPMHTFKNNRCCNTNIIENVQPYFCCCSVCICLCQHPIIENDLAFLLLVKSWRKCFCCCYCIVCEIFLIFFFASALSDTRCRWRYRDILNVFYLPSPDARAMPRLALC